MECACSFEDTPTVRGYCGNALSNVTTFMSLVDLMIRASCRLADPCRRVSPQLKFQGREFDFIVIGGGVGGSVIASRLSEADKWKTLLLEAGPEEPTGTGVPGFATSGIRTAVDWGFRTQPQSGACLNTGGSCYWPRGKMLGGTGAMTGMMYSRGNRAVYDMWARMGNVGWSFYEVLPFFKKSEMNKNINLVDKNYHGTSGPLVVQRFPHQPEFLQDLIKAGEEIGYRNGDLNGANQTGIGIAQAMVDDGVRASTARMYLRPIVNKRKNLIVSLRSHVTKIIIDPISKRAIGVEFIDKDGNKQYVTARKEIILSAGAVGSPHLLLLSGIGPEKDLKRHNITVIQDLRVGHNLHNHVSVTVPFLIKDSNKRMMNMQAIREYIKNGTGPLSSTGLTQATAFLTTKYARNGIPDIQAFFDGFSASCSASGESDECNDGIIGIDCGERTINARPTLVWPRSTGYLTLKSTNPFDYPLIYPNYFSEQRDVDVLMEGIKIMIRLTKTKAMNRWNPRLKISAHPKCEHIEFTSDKYWECVMRTYTNPENHQAGTCKMGPSQDDSVVDPELRVHGVPNLRVIDASVFPFVPNSNPIAAIVMMAEKGAFMIRSAWGNC